VGITIRSDAPPIEQEASGALRVGQTRVLLETVIGDFQDGATPEAIVQHYPGLVLQDVYAVIAYYLRHRQELDQYLAQRESTAEVVRKRVESEQRDLQGIRQQLLARGRFQE
jgi:uncharacterized protein (DUF433 family)